MVRILNLDSLSQFLLALHLSIVGSDEELSFFNLCDKVFFRFCDDVVVYNCALLMDELVFICS